MRGSNSREAALRTKKKNGRLQSIFYRTWWKYWHLRYCSTFDFCQRNKRKLWNNRRTPRDGINDGNDQGHGFVWPCPYAWKKNYLPWINLTSVTTDGSPNLTGKNIGLLKWLQDKVKDETPNSEELIFLHCIIHQEAMCKSVLKLENVVKVVVKLVNFIRATALNHRQFIQLLNETEGEHDDLLYHSNVCWLSLGNVFHHVWELKGEIATFLNMIDWQNWRLPWITRHRMAGRPRVRCWHTEASERSQFETSGKGCFCVRTVQQRESIQGQTCTVLQTDIQPRFHSFSYTDRTKHTNNSLALRGTAALWSTCMQNFPVASQTLQKLRVSLNLSHAPYILTVRKHHQTHNWNSSTCSVEVLWRRSFRQHQLTSFMPHWMKKKSKH